MFLTRLCLRVANTSLLYNTLGFRGVKRYYSEDQTKVSCIYPLPFGTELPNTPVLEHFKECGWIFVDKTDIIHRLINNSGLYILTRPRRFGKSLLLNTIKMIFEKNEIIKSLKIGKHYNDLKSHPVIKFDFSTNCEGLEGYIWNNLNDHANELQISIADLSIQDSLTKILEGYSKKKEKACILVDEYDKPLWVDDENLLKINMKVIDNFFTAVKSLETNVRFMLVIGVVRNKLSRLFSGLNNLEDLTLDSRYATLLGFTLEEIKVHFSNHLELFAATSGIKDAQSILEDMKKEYDGYQFSQLKTPGIFNPISVIECLDMELIKDYWISTGSGGYSMLIQAFKRDSSLVYNPNYYAVSMETIDPSNIDPIQLLWQTGYLTIKDYSNGVYNLRETNTPIKKYLNSIKFTSLYEDYSPNYFTMMRDAFMTVDIQDFMQVISNHIYMLNSKSNTCTEKEFEKEMKNIIDLAGFKPVNQQPVGNGVVDITFEVKGYENVDIAYVFELKKDKNASQALLQIKKKGHYKEGHQCKKIVCIGLSLDKEKKIIGDVEYIIIDSTENLIIEHGAYSFDLPLKGGSSIKTKMIMKDVTASKKKKVAMRFLKDEKK